MEVFVNWFNAAEVWFNRLGWFTWSSCAEVGLPGLSSRRFGLTGLAWFNWFTFAGAGLPKMV